MWLWSIGLGRLIFRMDPGEAEVQCQEDKVTLTGWVVAPKVHWDYSLVMGEDDLLNFMRMLTDPRVAA